MPGLVSDAHVGSLLERTDTIRDEVVAAQARGAQKIDRSRRIREADTVGAAEGPSSEGAERARGWSKSVPLTPKQTLFGVSL